MALYLFDGTWNTDDEDPDKDTNVVRFGELYKSIPDPEYLAGVGTRLGAVGHVLGGLFGVGGRMRIEEMADAVQERFNAGDRVIDIVGFSRGAALAVHFANKLASDGITLSDGTNVDATVRFLGLFDIVGSFGLSFDNIINFQEINLGWDIDQVAGNVQQCFHAMALDERRESFDITRLDPDNQFDNITEVWFRGVHSDIGGGNENTARSNIALQWMLDRARENELPIDDTKAGEAKYSRVDERAYVSENKDLKRDKRRTVAAGDQLHETASLVRLTVSQSRLCHVQTQLQYNMTGIELEKGAVYSFDVVVTDSLTDGGLECGPDGWSSEDLNWLKEPVVKLMESRRRCPDAKWFELLGSINDEDDRIFRIGTGDNDYTALDDGELYLFVNDLKSRYDNNNGRLDVVVTRKA